MPNNAANWIDPRFKPRNTRILEALKLVGELKIKSAFHKLSFIYGTQGAGSAAVRAASLWRSKCQTMNDKNGAKRKVVLEAFNLFEPGTRVAQYLNHGYQMMDMYYGPSLTTDQEKSQKYGLHGLRDPLIAEFIHIAMGFKGRFQMDLSGRKQYQDTFGADKEGWAWDAPKYKTDTGEITPTQEMSALIRWGIKKYGGELIFEGKQVFYHQVFAINPQEDSRNSRAAGDTELEAIDLFPYFKGGSRARYGKGTVIFHWGGREVVPTKCHFLSNWQGALMTAEETVKQRAVPGRDIGHWVTNPQGGGKIYKPFQQKTVNIKGQEHAVLQHTSKNRTKTNFTNLSFKGVPLRSFWHNFKDAPIMRNAEENRLFTADEIVELMFGSSSLGNKMLRSL